VVPLPPEVESLPRGIPIIAYANTVSTWTGLSYQNFLGRAQSRWAIDPDEMPCLRLVAQVTLAVCHFMAFERELQRDPTGASAIVQVVADLMLIMSSG